MKSPKDILLPYQRTWVDDPARFKIGCWSRQTGKSFSTASESVEDAMLRKTDWVCMSAGERQALEWMRKAREWTEAYQLAITQIIEDRDGPEALIKSAEIHYGNGSRLIAIPANPDTARGYSANLVLDEFAFHENPDAIWRAIFPAISNPLKGEKKIRVVSTPNGMGNKFYDLWEKGKRWSKHKITIHDAVKLGLPVDIDELREGLDDPDGWAQEYECEFIDSAAILLPYDLIARCESPEASADIASEYWSNKITAMRPLFMGVDFGRKRDLSVAWTAEAVGDVLHTREVLELPKMDTPTQIEHLRPRIAVCNRVCVDYTGAGIGLGDYLVKEFRAWNPNEDQFGKIELCHFSGGFKREIFPKLKVAFESARLRIPIKRLIREDLHAVHRITTKNGEVTYRAPHSDDGHSDRCVALALCNRAWETGKIMPFQYEASESVKATRGLRRHKGVLV